MLWNFHPGAVILRHYEQEENYNHRRDGGLKECEESVGCN